MPQSHLVNEINRIYEEFNLPTPQVKNVVAAIDSMLSINAERGSLHIILGESGCGVSTATKMCQDILLRRSINTIVLSPRAFSDENNPWEALLDYYGFTYQGAKLQSTKNQIIPYFILNLIRHAKIDCIILNDFLEGVITRVKKQQLINACLSLARTPMSINIIIGTTKRAYGATCTDDILTSIHCIPEWENGVGFSSFLGLLENTLSEKHTINIDLRPHAETIFKLCSGNTGNLFYLLKEHAIHALLTAPTQVPLSNEFPPLKATLQNNAYLFSIESS